MRAPKKAAAIPLDESSPPQLLRVAIADLVPNPRNPRVHPVSQLDRLKASLQRDGQTKPVLVRAANNMLIAGHGITLAAAQLGWSHLNALLWNCDQATADRVMLADNRLAELSTNDRARMAALLGDLEAGDYVATGFDQAEVAKMLSAMDLNIEVFELPVSVLKDDFWITARGPLPQQAKVLARIKTLLAEFPDVEVELGTVNQPPSLS